MINSVSVFATAPAGAKSPDSITVGGGSVFIAYAGGTDSQSGAGTSTIQQFSLGGVLQATYGISGSVDGLKVNPTSGLVYALQNQDGNALLSLINPVTKTVSGPLSYASPPYVYGAASTRGYDDVAFRANGDVLLSETNPTTASDAVIQRLNGGNAPAGTLTTTTVLTAGQTGSAAPDIDSLKAKPNGDLTLTDGDGGQFFTVSNFGTAAQSVAATQITLGGTAVSGLDDVLYPSAASGTLFLADQNNNRVLALSLSGLDLATPFASLTGANELVTVAADGSATPFFTGVGSPIGALAAPHGQDFLAAAAVPEPASLALLGTGLLGLLARKRRRG